MDPVYDKNDMEDPPKVLGGELEDTYPKSLEDHENSSTSMVSDHQKETHTIVRDQTFEESATHKNKIAYILCGMGLILGFILCFIEIGGSMKINQTMAIAIWMASFWLTETIPLVVTAFVPLFLFPFFGILKSAAVASAYMNNTIFLFISGFLVALTLERWGLERRFSLKVLSWCGARPGSLLFGMMGATFFLSMFVSNTATALMMVPNAVSVCQSLERSAGPGQSKEESKRFGIAMMLGIAYAANVGGMASLIGTPPNLVFQAQLKVLFPDSPEISFATWLGFGLPIGFLLLVLIWLYLRILYLRNFQSATNGRDFFHREYVALGNWCYEQVAVSLLFTLLALLWIFRSDIVFSAFTIKGWANIFPEPSFISDATIGMTIAFILFVLPARVANLPEDKREEFLNNDEEGRSKTTTTLLNWRTANKMPYDIVFLFGGGFALAAAFVESGLSSFLGEKLGGLDIALAAQVFLFIFVIIWLTEVTSNTATSNIFIPIAASVAVGSAVSPYTFMIPTAMACSCAFCLPIATPPNMVVFSSGRLPLREMYKAGVLLNLLCSVLILGAAFSLIPLVLDVEPDVYPEWAETSVI